MCNKYNILLQILLYGLYVMLRVDYLRLIRKYWCIKQSTFIFKNNLQKNINKMQYHGICTQTS